MGSSFQGKIVKPNVQPYFGCVIESNVMLLKILTNPKIYWGTLIQNNALTLLSRQDYDCVSGSSNSIIDNW